MNGHSTSGCALATVWGALSDLEEKKFETRSLNEGEPAGAEGAADGGAAAVWELAGSGTGRHRRANAAAAGAARGQQQGRQHSRDRQKLARIAFAALYRSKVARHPQPIAICLSVI